MDEEMRKSVRERESVYVCVQSEIQSFNSFSAFLDRTLPPLPPV